MNQIQAQSISPSDILPFVSHINRLAERGWTFGMTHMYDFSKWHVVFCHMATRSTGKHVPCYAHGYGESLRDAMKQAIGRANDSSQWRLVQDRPEMPPETRSFDY